MLVFWQNVIVKYCCLKQESITENISSVKYHDGKFLSFKIHLLPFFKTFEFLLKLLDDIKKLILLHTFCLIYTHSIRLQKMYKRTAKQYHTRAAEKRFTHILGTTLYPKHLLFFDNITLARLIAAPWKFTNCPKFYLATLCHVIWRLFVLIPLKLIKLRVNALVFPSFLSNFL